MTASFEHDVRNREVEGMSCDVLAARLITGPAAQELCKTR